MFGFVFYSVLTFFIFLSSLFGSNRENLNYKLNLIGSCWYFMISLFSWIWFGIFLGLSDYLDNGVREFPLIHGLIAGMCHAALLFLYGLFLHGNLV